MQFCSSITTEKIIRSYIPPEFIPSNWKFDEKNGIENVKKLYSMSNGLRSHYKSYFGLVDELETYVSGPGSERLINFETEDWFFKKVNIYKSLKNKKYVYKTDFLPLIYHEIMEQFSKWNEANESELPLETLNLFMRKTKLKFGSNEMMEYPERQLIRIGVKLTICLGNLTEYVKIFTKDSGVGMKNLEAVMAKWNFIFEEMDCEGYEEELMELLKKSNEKFPIQKNKWVYSDFHAVSFLFTQLFYQAITEMNEKPNVRMFNDGSNYKILGNELIDILKEINVSRKGIEEKSELGVIEFKDLYGILGNDVMNMIEFIKIPIDTLKFSTIPIPLKTGYCIPSTEAIQVLYTNIISVKKVLQFLTPDQLSPVFNFLKKIQLSMENEYFMKSEEAEDIMEQWEKLYEEKLKRYAKNVKEVREYTKFTIDDVKKELDYLNVTKHFPSIPFYIGPYFCQLGNGIKMAELIEKCQESFIRKAVEEDSEPKEASKIDVERIRNELCSVMVAMFNDSKMSSLSKPKILERLGTSEEGSEKGMMVLVEATAEALKKKSMDPVESTEEASEKVEKASSPVETTKVVPKKKSKKAKKNSPETLETEKKSEVIMKVEPLEVPTKKAKILETSKSEQVETEKKSDPEISTKIMEAVKKPEIVKPGTLEPSKSKKLETEKTSEDLKLEVTAKKPEILESQKSQKLVTVKRLKVDNLKNLDKPEASTKKSKSSEQEKTEVAKPTESKTCPKCYRSSEFTRQTNEKLRLSKIECKHLKKELAQVQMENEEQKETIQMLKGKLEEKETKLRTFVEGTITFPEESKNILFQLLTIRNVLQLEKPIKNAEEIFEKLSKFKNENLRKILVKEKKRFLDSCNSYIEEVNSQINLILSDPFTSLPSLPAFPFFSKQFRDISKKFLNSEVDFICETLLKPQKCVICLNKVKERKNASECQKCYCQLHVECAKKWLKENRTCPLCRDLMLDDDEFPRLF